ncbi:sulfolipid-1 biosynthesis phthioceranic/hydroxyphthioceranic acid synthase [Mycobacterium asiaticum]|uniref:sulfolipid-1 biosynthesis phthioceranic/hydroxyphthioceranic acid synthase n=1 Tax=Mycobacterium asiaticum TaxID=1790 RepID=UPI000687AF8F|nr:type I polyketide synthase [Mycobacterium asiaticum]ORA18195.1 polyketide synthase [Mycobacterium asiaticum DSM 44297]
MTGSLSERRGESTVDQLHGTPVAVIGMACRLPGGIDSPEAFWNALLRGADPITEVPAERWNADDYYDPEPGQPGRSVSRWGGFLTDVVGFDPEFFGINEREAAAIDPQHRLLMEVSWEAVEHAGLPPASLADSLTGVFVGMCHDDYTHVTNAAGALGDAYGFTGTALSMASGRVSYALGLRGPALTVDTACSSSLVAVHLACRSLHDQESNLALAGGCMVMLEPQLYASASGQGMLSPTGRCRPFDTAADGFVRSEACAMVLLKRLPDALRDGDRILAVVRGTATNQDGRTDTITTPSSGAQVAAYQAALAAAGVHPDTVGMVEAHGTGTPVGDPIEFRSLAEVYGANGRPCALGSAKSNIGHTEAAAGAVGLVKAILSLQHAAVPPMAHFTRLPDQLAAIDTGLFVPQAITSWPAGDAATPRRAAVSSYGMSGTNAHAIVEQAPPVAVQRNTGSAKLFVMSATSAEALRRTASRLSDWVGGHEVNPADLGYTLARRRGHRPVRSAIVADNNPELIERLREFADGGLPLQSAVGLDDRGPVWVFSGQGSQWPAMGADLLANEAAFAATVAAAEPLIARESGFSVTEALSTPQTLASIDRIQPTLFIFQVALAAALESSGARPAAVIGHSLGEVSAAVVAGVLSLADGVRVICRRSRLCTQLVGAGAMAAIELPARAVREELAQRSITDVVIAVIASPQSTVIGGKTEQVRQLVAAWKERDILASEVAVDVASHTPQVDPILDELAGLLGEITPRTPRLAYYSATLFDPRDAPKCDARYWVDNLRHAVRFSAATKAALEDGHRVFVELSPHPLLTRAIEQTAGALDMPVAAIPALRRGQPVPHGVTPLHAEIHNAGAATDFAALYPAGRLVDAPLPVWANRQLMLAPEQAARNTDGVGSHPLLGVHVRLMEEPQRHAWQSALGTAALPWAGDHQINGVAALPGAAYCEMALSAADIVLAESSEVRDLRFEEMLLLDEKAPVGATAALSPSGAATFVVQTGDQVRRAVAVLQPAGLDAMPVQDTDALLAAHPRHLDGVQIRKWFRERGIQFGPAFAGLTVAWIADGTVGTVVGEIALPRALRNQQSRYSIHPALLDACFQSVAAHPAVRGVANGGMLLPLSVRRLRRYGPTGAARYCHTRVTACGSNFEADIDVLDERGRALLVVRGLVMGTGFSDSADRDRLLNHRLVDIEWQPREVPEATADPGSWLLIDFPGDTLVSALAEALRHRGATVNTMCWPATPTTLHTALTGVSGVVVCAGDPGSADPRGTDTVHNLIHVARELPELSGETPRLYVLTRHGQGVRSGEQINLAHAGVRGLLRVVGAEHPYLRTTHIDIDAMTTADNVVTQLLSGSAEDETAWRDNAWLTARLRPAPLRPDERTIITADHRRDGVRLAIRAPGDLATIEAVSIKRQTPGPGQIEIAVSVSSVNFADVLAAFGRYPSFDGQRTQLGLDFVGVVTAVGCDVPNYRVGDRVGGISPGGCWGTFVTCDAALTAPLPPSLSDAHAAAITTTAVTAWYGLHELARIQPGDKVLIHSGTGGVGQAAIAIASSFGAEIFTTAGSPQRRKLLQDMGIQYIYDSRNTHFEEQIRRDTNGYGVDIVLNSLTGAAQQAGIDVLAFGGRFVEIGKRDIYSDSKLGLFAFRRNLSLHAMDLALMAVTHPQRVGALLREVYQRAAAGVLPCPPCTHYRLHDATDAIRAVSNASHVGKLLLDIPRAARSTAVLPPEQVAAFRADGSYIVTGGLGGLGLFLAEHMAAAGAGRIVLNSRSAPNQRTLETIELVRATGADLVVECGDIALADTADRLVAAATATGLQLRGVLHAAAVVEDATLPNITDQVLQRDWVPKVHGAWNLHQATEAANLDWFCSFSSAAALLGSPGQGAYAAANSWLDGFTHWRRSQGRPATAIAWGPWAELGRGAGLADTCDITMIAPDEGAHAFDALLRHTRCYSGYLPIVGSPWLDRLAERAPFGEAFRSEGPNSRRDNGIAAFGDKLAQQPQDEWPSQLRRLVSEQVGTILRRSVDPDRSLSDYGLDSLGNLELRTRLETETGIRLGTTDITTVRDLANRLCDKLTQVHDAPAPMSGRIAAAKYPGGVSPH